MASLEGTYLITEIVENSNNIQLPDSYRISLIKTADKEYSMSVKFGNSMGGSLTVTNGDDLSAGPIRSTMMMPPDEVYKVEIAFGTVLGTADKITLNEGILSISGTAGKVVATPMHG